MKKQYPVCKACGGERVILCQGRSKGLEYYKPCEKCNVENKKLYRRVKKA